MSTTDIYDLTPIQVQEMTAAKCAFPIGNAWGNL